MHGRLVLILILATSLSSISAMPIAIKGLFVASNPGIQQTPETVIAKLGEYFNVSITISDIQNLFAYQIYVDYPPDSLNVTNITEGDFLKRSTYFTFWIATWNNTEGLIQTTASLLLGSPEATGTGELFRITFFAKKSGIISLHFHDVLMRNQYNNVITPFETRDGAVVSISEGLIYNVLSGSLTFDLQIDSNSTVTEVHFEPAERALYFNVSGAEGTSGFAVVVIPVELLNAPENDWMISIDADWATRLITNNSTHTFICIAYPHSTHRVEIKGTIAIPEFSSLFLLALSVIESLLLVICNRKRHCVQKPHFHF